MSKKSQKDNKQDWITVVVLCLNYKEAEYYFKEDCKKYKSKANKKNIEIKSLQIRDYELKMIGLYASAEHPNRFVGFKIDEVVYVGTLNETMSRINASLKE